MDGKISAAGREVARPVTFGTLILAVAFIPLFTMKGVSGVLFKPMAITYALAIGGATLLAVTLTPAAIPTLLGKNPHDEPTLPIRAFEQRFKEVLARVVRRPKRVLLFTLIPALVLLALFAHLSREFLPKLEEGNLYMRAQLPASISLERSAECANRMRRIIRGCPDPERACAENERTIRLGTAHGAHRARSCSVGAVWFQYRRRRSRRSGGRRRKSGYTSVRRRPPFRSRRALEGAVPKFGGRHS